MLTSCQSIQMSRQVPKSLLLRQARRLSPATHAAPPTLSALVSQFTLNDNFDESTMEDKYAELKPVLKDISLCNVPFGHWPSADIAVLQHHLDTKAPLPWKLLTEEEKIVWYLLGYGSWGPRKDFSKSRPNDIQWIESAKVPLNPKERPRRVESNVLCSEERIQWRRKSKQIDPLTMTVGIFASIITLTAILV